VSVFIDHPSRQLVEHELRQPFLVDIVVCASGSLHLLDKITLTPDSYRREVTEVEPMYLPFECQRVLSEALGSYDYYCYVEDDIVVNDPLLFAKLSWFTDQVGPTCLLQPNRFEVASSPMAAAAKVYIDGPCGDAASRFQDTSIEPELTLAGFGESIRFVRPGNPNSACYFLDAEQMQMWTARPDFFDRDVSFVGPIESAASLGVMRTFRVYKPSWENAGFFEVEHRDARWWRLGVARDGAPAPIDRLKEPVGMSSGDSRAPVSQYHHEITAHELEAGESAHSLAILSVPLGARVLDIGAADGSVARALVQRGCQVWGVEANELAAARAKEVCEDVVVGDVELLDLHTVFSGVSFDVVLLLDVLEHLRAPVEVLRSATGLLTPHGCVVASIPNVGHGAVRLQLLKGRFVYTELGLLDQTHLRFFDRASVEAMFRDAGLIIRDNLRVKADLTETEIEIDLADFSAEVIDALRADPDAATYQFVFTAVPESSDLAAATSGSLLGNLQRRLHQADWELRELREHCRSLEAQLRERQETGADLEQRMTAALAHIEGVEHRAGYIALNRLSGALNKLPVLDQVARRLLRRAVKGC
jgi:2-polyprenyl-3-methyl-5-hydroxy-6-metoxy-1,4-benzoquinol methylase